MRYFLLLVFFGATNCKPLNKTNTHTYTASLEVLKLDHNSEIEQSSYFNLTKIRNLERALTEAINRHPQQKDLVKIRHKVRGFIVLLHSTCTKADRDNLEINTESLCSPIISKFKAMDYRIIDTTKINEH